MATSREQPKAQSSIPLKVGAATDIGRKRSQNQDSFASIPELGLFVVADGMGGHRGGEIASRIAVEQVESETRQILARMGAVTNISAARELVSEAIRRANSSIFERSSAEPELRGMGTTTTVLFLYREAGNLRICIGHVGDSRLYFYRSGSLWQLTRDHSLVQEKLRAGLITREAAKTDTMKNVITRSVGFEETVDVETYDSLVRPGDQFLICSDGLSGLIEDDEIRARLQNAEKTSQPLQTTVLELIADANSHGGDDNITGVLVQIG